MIDETVETRRPWRGSPRSCVLAGAFLRFVGIILTVFKLFRYAPEGEYVCATGARGLCPLRCGGIVLTCAPLLCAAYVRYVVAEMLFKSVQSTRQIP